MLKPDEIVINTSPLIALVAALGDLSLLESLYTSVWVPFEVCQEILTGDSTRFAAAEFQAAEKLNKQTTPLEISSFLLNLDALIETRNEPLLENLNFKDIRKNIFQNIDIRP